MEKLSCDAQKQCVSGSIAFEANSISSFENKITDQKQNMIVLATT